MRQLSSLPFVLLVGCGGAPSARPATPVEVAPPASSETEPTGPPPSSTAPAPVPYPKPDRDCPSDRIWDVVAGGCRLFPGGGYGWAGCSMAKAPPNGEACVSGTHWAHCDCECDPPAKWNRENKQCEPVPTR